MTTWRKPAACDAGHCLEVAADAGDIAIRESVRPNALVVTSRANFAAFVAAARAGEYDDLCEETNHG